jgi:hypothetical protein
MKRDDNDQNFDLTGRLRDLEQFTGSLVARQQPEAEAIPIHGAPITRVPVPRRSRVFLRHGQGHGVFAELTLTAPQPRPAMD